jgi:hypothetical protein
MGKYKEVPIREFPLHEMVCEDTPKSNHSKIVIAGKPGSGKSVLIRDIVRTYSHRFPAAVVFSGTEDNNNFYKEMFQDLFIYSEYKEEIMEAIDSRQKQCQRDCENPNLLVVIDDCSDDPKFFRRPLFQKFFKMARHWNIMLIFAIQYVNDIPAPIKAVIDYMFIFRYPNNEDRKKIYNNYAGITGSLQNCCSLLDQITGDFTCMVLDNRSQNNDSFADIYYYKARLHSRVNFGCVESKGWHDARYDPNYLDNVNLRA